MLYRVLQNICATWQQQQDPEGQSTDVKPFWRCAWRLRGMPTVVRQPDKRRHVLGINLFHAPSLLPVHSLGFWEQFSVRYNLADEPCTYVRANCTPRHTPSYCCSTHIHREIGVLSQIRCVRVCVWKIRPGSAYIPHSTCCY